SFELYFQCHWFEVNQTVRSDVMAILLKNGQSASRKEAVKEMKERRSTVCPWCQSTVIPKDGPSLFCDQFRPRTRSPGVRPGLSKGRYGHMSTHLDNLTCSSCAQGNGKGGMSNKLLTLARPLPHISVGSTTTPMGA
ncbi:hypothetical protein IGI04_030350, partial [Brassica rapa subsp. trilocularis]